MSRVVKTTCIAAAAVILLLIFWYAVDVLLLVFAGMLVGVFLHGLSHPLSQYTGLRQRWSLLIVLFALGGLIGLVSWLLARRVVTQANQLVDQLPIAFAAVTSRLEAYDWGNRVLAEIPTTWELFRGHGTVLGRITGIFSGVLGVLLNFAIIIVLGCYIAARASSLLKWHPTPDSAEPSRSRARSAKRTLYDAGPLACGAVDPNGRQRGLNCNWALVPGHAAGPDAWAFGGRTKFYP